MQEIVQLVRSGYILITNNRFGAASYIGYVVSSRANAPSTIFMLTIVDDIFDSSYTHEADMRNRGRPLRCLSTVIDILEFDNFSGRGTIKVIWWEVH